MTKAMAMSKGLRLEIEGLRRLGKVEQPSEKARQRMLESIFLNGITEFESFLEDLFLAAVSKRIRPGATKTIVNFHDPDTARSLLLRPRESYLDWMPIERSLERADKFLVDGLPFSRLGTRPNVKLRLKVASAVRNAVAHKGAGARTRFHEMTSGKYRSPGEYLSAKLGPGTVCDGFLEDFVRFGHALCVSDAEALRLLGPEGPYRAGTVVNSGKYQCAQCGSEYALNQREALACPVCDPLCTRCGSPTSRSATFNRT
jgi:hypothetical protein